MAIIPCPSYIQGFDPSESAFRYCTDNGTWFVHPVHNTTWSDYTKCYNPNDGHTIEDYPELIAAHLPHISRMYNIGYGLSFASLLLAVVIMLYFRNICIILYLCCRKLRCPRNTIHINLFGSFMLRAAISFLKENLLVRGVGFPSDVRFTEDDRIEFINEGPHVGCKLFFSLFHYILGANYMWILVEALYLHSLITVAVFSESSSIKGFISFGWGKIIFEYLDVGIHTQQLVNFIIFLNVIRGFFVSLLFCFFNGEVQSEFKKKWKRYRLRKGRSFGQRSTKDTMVSFVTRTRNESAASISGSGDSKDGISNIDDCLKETSCLNGVNRDVYLHGKNKLYNGQNGHVYPCDNSFKDPKVSTAFECEEAKGLLSSDKNRFS
ncbi:hypothetical protein KUTeg_008190 [Tegillarca granosa]|uniref:Uncharacterized protein n=1 Tax=Tegillarca granosa TaxID=220873 RepID=A0ABQ9F8F2_TEGGR|nr:hypothetical protein KUTeg_008190 [Tegillarca granosa]